MREVTCFSWQDSSNIPLLTLSTLTPLLGQWCTVLWWMLMLLPDQATYSTVQYSTVQYSTVQYSPHHPAPHELLGLDESVGLGLREGEVGAGTCDLQAGDLHPGHLRQSGRSRAVNKPL